MFDIIRTINKLDFIIKQIDFIKESNNNIKSGDDFMMSFQGTLIFNSTIMCLQTIGESLRSIELKTYPDLLDKYPEIPWNAIIALRNIISHDYCAVDPDIIFNILCKYIDPLRDCCLRIIEDIS